jgi:hypothetical protein
MSATGPERSRRRPPLALVLALVALAGSVTMGALLPAAPSAATKDALIAGYQFFDNVPASGGASGLLACPVGERALSGGIVQSGGPDGLLLRANGPLNEAGTFDTTGDGDKPRSWYSAAANFSAAPIDLYMFVICAKARATIEVTQFTMAVGERKERYARCHGKARAVGGGVIQSGPSGTSYITQSGPTDARGKYGSTRDGDVPKRWLGAMQNQGSESFKAFAVCARGSKAKLEVASKQVDVTGEADKLTDCPGAKRAIGGGVIHNRGLDARFSLTTAGPLDSSGVTAATTVGDKPTQWYGGIDSIFGDPGKFKVIAVCE